MVWAPIATEAAGRWRSANGRMKLSPLAIDRPRTFDSDMVRVHSKKQSPVAILKCRVSTQRDRIHRVILFSLRATEQFPGRGNMKRDIALEFCRTNYEGSSRNQYGATALAIAGINRCLQRSRVESCAIALGAEAANIVDSRTQVVAGSGGLYGRGGSSFSGHCRCEENARRRQ